MLMVKKHLAVVNRMIKMDFLLFELYLNNDVQERQLSAATDIFREPFYSKHNCKCNDTVMALLFTGLIFHEWRFW